MKTCIEIDSEPGLDAKIPAEGVVIAGNFTLWPIRGTGDTNDRFVK